MVAAKNTGAGKSVMFILVQLWLRSESDRRPPALSSIIRRPGELAVWSPFFPGLQSNASCGMVNPRDGVVFTPRRRAPMASHSPNAGHSVKPALPASLGGASWEPRSFCMPSTARSSAENPNRAILSQAAGTVVGKDIQERTARLEVPLGGGVESGDDRDGTCGCRHRPEPVNERKHVASFGDLFRWCCQ